MKRKHVFYDPGFIIILIFIAVTIGSCHSPRLIEKSQNQPPAVDSSAGKIDTAPSEFFE